MIRRIIPWPDQRLRQRAPAIGSITDEIREIWQDMVDTMEAMPGVGLAAPQIGIAMRLAVVDASDERGQAVLMANPEIIEASKEMRAGTEASPNLPGVSATLKRPNSVVITYLDPAGMRVRKTFTGLWSASVLHQIDHLNGRMFFDNLSRTKRDMLLRKARKATR